MRANQIQPGDILMDAEGHVAYTVKRVVVQNPHIVVIVRFADGGLGERIFESGKEVPLTRP